MFLSVSVGAFWLLPRPSYIVLPSAKRHIYSNQMTSLEKGVFDKNAALTDLYVFQIKLVDASGSGGGT